MTRDARNPAWSPSGSRIAFNRGGDIFTIKPDGSGTPTALTSEGNNFTPDWQPGP